VVFRQGGAERGDGAIEASLGKGNHIHVAFDDNQRFSVSDGFTSEVQAIERAAL
jgi:hypothetical protein